MIWVGDVVADPVLLTEDQAIAWFFQHNIALIAARLDIDQARAQEVIAAAIPNPVFSLTLNELSNQINKAPDRNALPGVSPQIQQLIETAGKRGLRIEAAGLGTEATELDLQNLTRMLTNAVRHAFYGLMLAQQSLQVATDNAERYQRINQANALRLQAGDISATDYSRIELESLKAQSEVDRAKAMFRLAQTALLLLLGWPENSLSLQAAGDWPGKPMSDGFSDESAFTRAALEHRPDFKAAKIRIQQTEKKLELARRLAYPDVTVSAAYARDPGNYFTNTGVVGVSVPLPIFYRQEGEIAKAGVDMNQAELTLRQTERDIRADVVKSLSAWQSADAVAKRFEQSMLQRMQAVRTAQEFAYQKGAVGLLDLIEAERSYKSLMLDYYQSLANRSNAWADLLMALGWEKWQ